MFEQAQGKVKWSHQLASEDGGPFPERFNIRRPCLHQKKLADLCHVSKIQMRFWGTQTQRKTPYLYPCGKIVMVLQPDWVSEMLWIHGVIASQYPWTRSTRLLTVERGLLLAGRFTPLPGFYWKRHSWHHAPPIPPPQPSYQLSALAQQCHSELHC